MRVLSFSLTLGKRRRPPRAANIDHSEYIETEGLPIPGFPDCFRAHISGDISKNGRILKGHTHYKGYRRVTIRRDGVDKHHYVHKLIALAFLGPRPDGFHVDHINFDKVNNTPGNLRYLTADENTRRRKPKVASS